MKFNLLKIVGCIGLFGASMLGFTQERPNILWLTFEDTSPQFIGCYGDKHAETPVMDLMAAQGVRFTKAFSTGTVCSPSRSAIITGVPTYKMGSGHHRSSFPIPEFIKGFPNYLKTSGYYVTNNNKTDYNIANMDAFVSDTWDESSNKAGWWNRKSGQPFFSVFNIPDSHQSRTMSMSYDWYEANVLAYLKPERNDQQTKNREFNDTIGLNISSVQKFADLNKKGIIADSVFNMPPIYRDSEAMRRQMARVYNSIKLTDLKMGQILQRLNDDDLIDDTIIFIFADHGEGMPRAKTNGIGLGYRVPFIIWFPEKYKHLSPWGTGGVVSDELIDFKDLAPTILNLAGIDVPDYMDGRPLLKKNGEPAPNYTYLSSDRADNGPDLVRTITDGRYVYSRNFMPFYPELKYIRYIEIGEITKQMRSDYESGQLDDFQKSMFETRPIEVLYDLQSDPWETINLAKQPEYQGKLNRMRNNLKQKVIQERDIHFLPEYELSEISKKTTPYQFRLNDDEYPLQEIYTIANLVGKTDKSSIERLFESLKSKNKFIRYWGSLGLYAVKSHLKQSNLLVIKRSLKDSYPPVKINTAALLYASTQDLQAEEVLKSFIVSPNDHLALSAINFSLYFNNRLAFIPSIQNVYDSDMSYKVKAAAIDFLDLEGLLPPDHED